MPHHEDHFDGHDGLKLYRQTWLPEGETKATVVLIHGFTEHSGRYADVAEHLNRHGYGVFAPDLRGHGRSEGERAFIDRFDEFLDDLDRFVALVGREQPRKPLFLVGHSMGGTIVARFVATRQPDVRGAVLSAPAARVGKHVFPLLRCLAAVVSRLLPRLRIVQLGTGGVSRDPEVVRSFQSDPLVFHGRFPVRIGAEILRVGGELQRDGPAMRTPLLILQGTGDRIVDPAGARDLHARAASPDKTLRLYPGLYHDLLHEPERDEVRADLVRWLDARC